MTQGTRFGPFLVGPHKRSGKLTGRWQVTIPKAILGKRTRKYFESKKMAEDYAKKLHNKYNRGQLSLPQPTPKERITFRQAVAEWKEDERARVGARRKRKSSLQTDSFRISHALKYFGDECLIDITKTRLLEYQKHRLDAGKSPFTVNSDLKKVKQVLNWAHDERYIDRVPKIDPEPAKLKNRIVPTMDEVVRIIEHLPKRLQPLVTFMAVTGCRSGEAFNLTWDCVDAEEGLVGFRSKTDWQTKTDGSEREVPISRKLIDMLRNQRTDSDYVFSGRKAGKPISNMRKAFATAVKKADIRRKGKRFPITPKTLRKAYATHQAIQKGMPAPLLKALLGHSPNSEVTDRFYVIPQENDMRKAVFNLQTAAMNDDDGDASFGNNLATGLK